VKPRLADRVADVLANWRAIMVAGRMTTLLGLVLAPSMLAGAATALAQGLLSPQTAAAVAHRPPLIRVQNPSTPLTLPQMAEPPVSPINPSTLPGSTAASGGSASGSNPITGLPCNGSGSIAVSGAGGLPGTATVPPPPTSSIYGSQSNLGSC